jgi:PAS domain S-box-containing protein
MAGYWKHPFWQSHLGAVALVGAAYGARAWLLGGFDPAIPYVTFYPAVMLASLLGGLTAGLLATLLSASLAAYFFIEPIGSLYIDNQRDLLGILVFVVSGSIVSCIGEYYLRQHARLQYTTEELIQSNASLQSETIERSRLIEQLAEHELHFRTLANSGQALIWTSGPDKLCNYFNEPWLCFTGRTLEQELGNGWAEGLHPDDFQRCLDIYISAFDKRENFSMEYRLHHISGNYRWIVDQGKPRYDSHGAFLGYIGHCLDITGLKQAEEELRTGRAELARKNTLLESEILERRKVEKELKKAHDFSKLVTDMSASLCVVLELPPLNRTPSGC